MTDWNALRAAIAGEVVVPGSADYEERRKPEIHRFHDIRPQGVVSCTSPADVAGALAFARRSGLETAVRSGGHCFAGRSSTQGLVIDVSPMNSVTVDEGTVTVGAGTRLGRLYDVLAEQGLTIPAGCGPTVGISGLTLGGGLGILGRKHGLTSDSLLAAQVVLAGGRVVDCDGTHDEDLFWLVRGAGADGPGVVTSLTFRTLAAPPATGFHLVWPHTEAVAVIEAWQGWGPPAPDELAASLLFTTDGDRAQVNVFGTLLGTEAETVPLLDDLVVRVGSQPVSAEHAYRSLRDTKRYLTEVPLGHAPAEDSHPYSKSEFFRQPLPGEAVKTLVEQFLGDRVPGQARELDFMPWGGAYNRLDPGATAFAHRRELFMIKHAVIVPAAATAGERGTARDWLHRSWSAVRPYGSGGVYPNFPDPDLENAETAYFGANRDRVQAIRQRYLT